MYRRSSIWLRIIMLVITQKNFSQEQAYFNPLNSNITDFIPPLTALIDSAISHSPEVKFWQAVIRANESKILTQKRLWMKNLGVSADVRYGTYDNFLLNETPAGVPTTVYSNQTQTRYGTSLYLKLPLYELANRKNNVRFAKEELNQAQYNLETKVNEIRERVIKQYYELILAQKVLKVQSEALQNSNINLDMAEKRFKDSEITLSELTSISESNSRAKALFESAKVDFVTSYKLLEELVGFEFNIKVK